MKAIEDLTNHKLLELDFPEMRKRLDEILLISISHNVWASWDLRSGIALNLKTLRVVFLRPDHGPERIVQSYVFHNLTLDEAFELAKMLETFDCLKAA